MSVAMACAVYQGQDFWKHVAGPAFQHTQFETSKWSNKLANFLDEGNREVTIKYKEGNYVSLQQFQQVYGEHLKTQGLPYERVTETMYNKFKKRNFKFYVL